MSIKNSNLLTIILSVISIITIVIALDVLKDYKGATDNGQLVIELLDIDGDIMSTQSFLYFKGDTLISLIENNFDDVMIEDTFYGPFLKAIEGYVTPNDFSTYLSLYVNNEYSVQGISQIRPSNNMIVSIRIVSSI
jgi:hypothetical protein